MDNSPTSTINFDRAAPTPQKVEMPEPRDPKKVLFIVALALSAAILLCFLSVIVLEIANRVGPSSSGPVTPENGVDYVFEEYGKGAIHRGDLILVKEGYEYVFPNASETNLVTVLKNKNNAYSANGKAQLEESVVKSFNELMTDLKNETGFTGIYVNEGYRSYEKQESYFNNPAIKDEVAAGLSEHHTGLGMDLKVYKNDLMFELEHEPEILRWLKENGYRRGFVDRYPDEKIQVTGIDHDWATSTPSTHIRYVGYAHAYYMTKNDLCLEEYLPLLSANYSYGGEHLTFAGDDGNAYEIYYVKAEGDKTAVPVPADYEYSVSGDNMGGFVVTVCFGKSN